MMVAARSLASACIALAPSLPAQRVDPSIPLRKGEFTSAEYGIISLNPNDQPAMPDLDPEERRIALASLARESRYARDERKRGIVIESLPCPLLVVTGERDTAWPAHLYDNLWLKADRLAVPGASHSGLVLNRCALAHAIPGACNWLQSCL
jgi:pimeloyl-ACP methyl ester carboxylesterase